MMLETRGTRKSVPATRCPSLLFALECRALAPQVPVFALAEQVLYIPRLDIQAAGIIHHGEVALAMRQTPRSFSAVPSQAS